MATITNMTATDAGDGVNYAVYGMVNGRGYRILVPKADVDAAVTKSAKQQVVAAALKIVDQAANPVSIDLSGTVTL